MPHEFNLRWGQGVGLADEAAEGASQVQSFGGEGAGGFDGAGVLIAQEKEVGGGLVSIVRTDTCTDEPESNRLSFPCRNAGLTIIACLR